MADECPHSYRAFNASGDVIRMACDQWDCPECGKRNAYRWAERVRFGIALWPGHEAYFWTLTLPPWVRSAKTGFRILPGCWDRFRRAVAKSPGKFNYAAFVELHPQRGHIPHFHIISLKPAPSRLKDIAVHSGFGHQAKEVRINGKMAAIYVTKYVSKQGAEMPSGFRRVRLSHDWPKLPKPAYDIPVYPVLAHESVRAYLRRISLLTGLDYIVLQARWLDRGHDTAI